jgi:hypothetical protein
MGLPDDLPPGRLVMPTLWVSDEPVPDAVVRWVAARAAHPTTGWWPLLLAPDIGLGSFCGPSTESVDAERFLAERWSSERVQLDVDDEGDDRWGDHLPYDAWPGLAPASAKPGPDPDPDAAAASLVAGPELKHGHVSDPFSHLDLDPDAPGPSPFVDAEGRARLGLVETPDSAGAIAASGWEHELGGGPECTAVLRSWQQRFGARLVALGYDWLAVTVAGPVGTIEQSRRVAAEHVAFCSEILGEVTFEEYAKALVATTVWLFWWD